MNNYDYDKKLKEEYVKYKEEQAKKHENQNNINKEKSTNNNKNDNNIRIYSCAICGKNYTTLADRIICETACLKKQEEEAKRKEAEKKVNEKNARYKEVNDAVLNAYELLNKYLKDYGSMSSDNNFSAAYDSMMNWLFKY